MDARIDVYRLLSLGQGDAHVIRNAGGFKARILAETGLKPDWSVESFDDLEEDVRQSIRRIVTDPFIPYTDQVRGFVFELETGRLCEVR